MSWEKVGGWIKDNAGTGASLVGSLLVGNAPGAIAAGVALVSSATGSDDPEVALKQLQGNPEALVRLKELALEEDVDIRKHIRELKEIELADKQAEHHETQETIRSGDNADDKFVRWTRPGQSWCSLMASFFYVFVTEKPDVVILGALLALPFAYAGLRQVGKGIDAFTDSKTS